MKALVSFLFLLFALSLPNYSQQPINYGETITESISPSGEVDVYTFSGIENEKVTIRLTESTVFLEPFVELFSPSGSFLISDSDGAQAIINITLPSTGTYTIFVSDKGGDDTGNYGLFIQRMVNPGNTTIINYGETLTGDIFTGGDVDTYSFSGNEGDKLILRLTESIVFLEPFVELFDTAGDLLLAVSDGAQAKIEVTLPTDGSYTILVSDSYPGDDTGNYGLFIQRMVNPGNTTIINYGETLTGSISVDGDVDTYSFLGGAGDSVIIRMTESIVFLEPFVELFDTAGDSLLAVSDASQAEIGIRLQATGFYTILASDSYPGDDTGNYSIFIFGFISSQILVFPSLIEFGDVPVGQIANDSFIVFNRGISSVNIDSITINGTNPANFSVDTTSFSLDPGDSISVSVFFAPDALDNFSATINIYSIGGNGTINLNGTGIISTDIEENVELFPDEFQLYQNYPNPFNPSTTIKYQIQDISFVTLKVYDVLGNEVAILINEEKLAGSYEVSFSATNLSSGIYFYKLQAGSFVETKKMILMK